MNKFWIILSHTYMTRLKSKAFLISTIITLLFIIGFANIDKVIEVFSSTDTDEVLVIDESGGLSEPLTDHVAQITDDIKLTEFTGTEKEAKQLVQNEEFSALVVLTLNEENLPEAVYYANSMIESYTQITIEQQLQQIKVAMSIENAGLDGELLASIYGDITFTVVSLDESAKTDEELSQARGIIYIMLFILYFSVVIYGQMIATDIATEKSSRVMEILISSAPPVTHMVAKIVGIGLLGLTQMVLFLITGYAMIKNKKDELTEGFFEFFGFQDESLAIYLYAIIFFILGYLLYATLAAMLGSLVSRVEDVQQLIMPIMFLVMIAFFIAIFGLSMPESNFVKITSFIPFFSPMIMFLRVGMLTVPLWEIIVSISLLVGTIILFAILAARVYRGGVLMYGAGNSIKDIKKALTLAKKD